MNGHFQFHVIHFFSLALKMCIFSYSDKLLKELITFRQIWSQKHLKLEFFQI